MNKNINNKNTSLKVVNKNFPTKIIYRNELTDTS